jgi:hypothetical protein
MKAGEDTGITSAVSPGKERAEKYIPFLSAPDTYCFAVANYLLEYAWQLKSAAETFEWALNVS